MATYFVCSGAAGTGTGASWVNACVSIPALMTAQAIAGGDTIYVHNTHAYLAGAAITWTLPESGTGNVSVLCVNGGDAAFTALGAAMGTTVGTLTTGASESTNGNNIFTIHTVTSVAASLYVHGIQIKAGAGGNSGSADISIATSNSGRYTFSACTFWTDSTNVGAVIAFFNGSTPGARVYCKDCVFRFGATTQIINWTANLLEMWNCSISASGSSPTTLFTQTGGTARGRVLCHSCDWSLATNLITQAPSIFAEYLFYNCTMGTTYVTGSNAGVVGGFAEFHACKAVDGSNGADVLAYYKEDAFGVVQDDQTVYVTSSPGQGTQDDGTATSYSLKMTPSALVFNYQPLYTPWITVKVPSTGSKTITMKVADTEGALLKDSELWMEVSYMGGAAPANSPQTTVEGTFPLVGTYQDVTAAGSNLTDTGEAWTGIAETGTYTLSKTITLDEQGYIRCRVGLAKDTTNPVYVDGKIGVA